MADSNRFTNAITITPPLTANEIRNAPNSVLEDVRLRVRETATPTDDGETVVRTADAIEPTCNGFSGRNLVEDLQLLVDHLLIESPDRMFGGHIEARWDQGCGLTPPSRYVVRDGHVVEIKAQIVWPGEADVLSRVRAAVTRLRADHDFDVSEWAQGVRFALNVIETALDWDGAE